MKLRILVRTDVDWRAMDAEGFTNQQDDRRPIRWIKKSRAVGALALWDSLFDMAFFEYRAALSDIARRSVEAAAADAVSFGQPSDLEEWLADPDDEIVVPVDDDDFLGPTLPDVVGSFVDDVGVVLWNQAMAGFREDVHREVVLMPMPYVLQTNCALRKSFLRDQFEPAVVRDMLAHHPQANREITRRLTELVGAEEVPDWNAQQPVPDCRYSDYLDQCHGLYNSHIGSISQLAVLAEEDDPAAILASLDWDRPTPLPDAIEPMATYVREFDDLTSSLAAGACWRQGSNSR